jgi:hypothetical protein
LRRCLLSGPIVNPPNGQFSGFLHALTAKCPLRRLPYPDPVMKGIIFLCVGGTWLYNYSRESFGSGWCYSINFGALLILLRAATAG